jgi:hypothetical protein
MATGHQPLLEPENFRRLAALVDRYGVRNLVETGTGPASSGMEAAARLGLQGYSCDVFGPCAQRAMEIYPSFTIEHSNSVDFLRRVLPTMEGPTFFWLDGHCPTDSACTPGAIWPLYEEMELIRDLKRGFAQDVFWMDDIAFITDKANPWAATWDVDLRGEQWFGDDRKWADYLAVFAESHDHVTEFDCILQLTPKAPA